MNGQTTGAIVAAAALLLAGCANVGPPAGPTLPALEDFRGCNLTMPDGRPVDCVETPASIDAPAWYLGSCFYEDNRFGDWLAPVQWTAQGLFGMGADLTPGRQAVMAAESNGRQYLLHLRESGEVAFPMEDYSRVDGSAITFVEDVHLTVRGQEVPVEVHWQSIDGEPIATYEAEGGYWFHNITTLDFLGTTLMFGYMSFNITGQDFSLRVERLIYQNIGVGIGSGHYTGRPCFGPNGP